MLLPEIGPPQFSQDERVVFVFPNKECLECTFPFPALKNFSLGRSIQMNGTHFDVAEEPVWNGERWVIAVSRQMSGETDR